MMFAGEIDTNMKNCSNCDCRKNKSCGSGVETLAKEMMCYACQHILADMVILLMQSIFNRFSFKCNLYI